MKMEQEGAEGQRLAVIAPSAQHLIRLRGGLIAECAARRIRVLALAPGIGPAAAGEILAIGGEARTFETRLPGWQAFPQLRAIRTLAQVLRDWHPDAILVSGNDTAAIAATAARKARVKRIALIVSEIERRQLGKGLRIALKRADVVIAHNEDDRRLIEASGLKPSQAVLRVPGAGTRLAPFAPLVLPDASEPLIFVCAARLDRVKGVLDYLEAARLSHIAGLSARFVLAGPEGTGKDAIGAEVLSRYAAHVRYAGDVSDLGQLFANAHIAVSPSHLEGMPHAVLQAMAAGRPIVATDIAGGREIVDENINGTLAAPGDPAELASAFARVAKNRSLLPSMGRASRAKAERSFSAGNVNGRLIAALGLA